MQRTIYPVLTLLGCSTTPRPPAEGLEGVGPEPAATPPVVAVPPAPSLPIETASSAAPAKPDTPPGAEGRCPDATCSYPGQLCCSFQNQETEQWRHACVDASATAKDPFEACAEALGPAPWAAEVRRCDSSGDCSGSEVCCRRPTDFMKSVTECVPAAANGALVCSEHERCSQDGEACATVGGVCAGGKCVGKSFDTESAFGCKSPAHCPKGAHCCAHQRGSECGGTCYQGTYYACTKASDCPKTIAGMKVQMGCTSKMGEVRLCDVP